MLIIVLLITTFGSLIQAVGIGLALACLLFMKKSGDLSEEGLEVGAVADLEGAKPWQDELEFMQNLFCTFSSRSNCAHKRFKPYKLDDIT